MITIQEIIDNTTRALEAAGINTARLDCLVLLEDVLTKDRGWVLAHPEQRLSDKQHKRLHQLVERRVKREPLAYIRGKSEFYGREFNVNNDVLIPRPESEAIIDLLGAFLATHQIDTLLDVGTGSGCLAIVAKLQHPNLNVVGIDISPGALKVARRNAQSHHAQVEWVQQDILSQRLASFPPTKHYAAIANLPYVPVGLITSAEITMEPTVALFSGDNGLSHYRAMFQHMGSTSHLPSALITESLLDQHSQMEVMAQEHGFTLTETRDLVQLFVYSDQ